MHPVCRGWGVEGGLVRVLLGGCGGVEGGRACVWGVAETTQWGMYHCSTAISMDIITVIGAVEYIILTLRSSGMVRNSLMAGYTVLSHNNLKTLRSCVCDWGGAKGVCDRGECTRKHTQQRVTPPHIPLRGHS